MWGKAHKPMQRCLSYFLLYIYNILGLAHNCITKGLAFPLTQKPKQVCISSFLVNFAPFVVVWLLILHLFAGKKKGKITHTSCALVSLARFPQNSCTPEKFCQAAKWNAHGMNIYAALMIGFLHPWITKVLTRTDNKIGTKQWSG